MAVKVQIPKPWRPFWKRKSMVQKESHELRINSNSNQTPWDEFSNAVNTLSEAEAKQWLVKNLSRFDSETQSEILLAFYNDVKDKHDGVSNPDDMTYQEFRNALSVVQDAEPQNQSPYQLSATHAVIDQLNQELRENNETGDPSISDALSSFGRALKAYQNVPQAEKELIGRELSQRIAPAAKALGLQSRFDEVITVGAVVVAYRPKIANMGAEQRQKIRNAISAILTANPGANLEAIQDSIGITNVRVQRPDPPAPNLEKGYEW